MNFREVKISTYFTKKYNGGLSRMCIIGIRISMIHKIMPIDSTYNNKQQILTIKAHGYISVDNVEVALLDLLNSDEFHQNVNTIWDIRDMNFDNIDIVFIKRAIAVQKKYAQQRGAAKIAILSNYLLAAPIVKLYMILARKLLQKYNSFTSLDDAEQWLCSESLKP